MLLVCITKENEVPESNKFLQQEIRQLKKDLSSLTKQFDEKLSKKSQPEIAGMELQTSTRDVLDRP